jgi:hypothetical protein
MNCDRALCPSLGTICKTLLIEEKQVRNDYSTFMEQLQRDFRVRGEAVGSNDPKTSLVEVSLCRLSSLCVGRTYIV